MHGFRKPHPKRLRKKFCEAENLDKTLMESRGDQRDSSSRRDDFLPIWYNDFIYNFDYAAEYPTSRALQRAEQGGHEVVTRSVIGQQSALATNTAALPSLLPTVAPANRQRGSHMIAEDVNVSATTVPSTLFTRNTEC